MGWTRKGNLLRSILQQFHSFKNDRYLIENPLDEEKKFPK